ncbi:MAG: AAA family ATPase [Nanoarchaeota archaeon]
MPDLFKNMLGGSESLFKDVLVLDVDYIPPIIEGREDEQQWIASCIKPLFNSRPGKNAFVTGVPGIGKTLATKYLLQELERENSEIYPIYVNCWKNDTAHKIVLEVCSQLGYTFTHNRTTNELMKEIVKIINKKSAVIVLDEVDKIEDENIVYHILEDVYMKALILISNDSDFLTELDSRIKSRLNADVINFEKYNFDETYNIMKKRVEHAFVANVFEKDAFEVAAEKAYSLGDVRAGLFLLKEAGEIAEGRASRKITLGDANKAVEKLKEFKIRSSLSFNETDQKILDIIKANSGKSATDLFEIFQREGGDKTYRTFWRKIESLKKSRAITVQEVYKGPGRTTLVHYGSLKKITDYGRED